MTDLEEVDRDSSVDGGRNGVVSDIHGLSLNGFAWGSVVALIEGISMIFGRGGGSIDVCTSCLSVPSTEDTTAGSAHMHRRRWSHIAGLAGDSSATPPCP